MLNARVRLTAAYSAAVLGASLLLALAVWIASFDASERRMAEVLRRQQLVEDRADTALKVLSSDILSSLSGQVIQLLGAQPLPMIGGSQQTIPDLQAVQIQQLAGAIQSFFDRPQSFMGGLPDYFIVFGEGNTDVYRSLDLRSLLRAGDLSLIDEISRMPPDGGHSTLNYHGRLLTFFSRAGPACDPKMSTTSTPLPCETGVSHVVTGTELPSATFGMAGMAATVVLALPLILVIAVSVGYAIAGRPLRPIDGIINEVERITDGRSLHRRLAIDHSTSELARLASTLNEMMGRLEVSFTALRRFTADASHELNTPLAVLRADIERAMSPTTKASERMVALEEALREIRRMSGLVDSLLTLARADEGRFDLPREPVELGDLAQEVFETALLLGEDAGLSVKMTLIESGVVLGDRDRLRQLFLNLVTNAIKYTPAGGRVELSLSRRLDGIAFAVRDTGIGIAAADLPHVFDRFWRADSSRTRETGVGFGLGLPISQWIAHAHGGTLTATSKMGKGSTFTVTLPAASEPMLPPGETQAGQAELAQRADPAA